MILSWLTFQGMLPVLPLRQCGDKALVRLAGAERFDDAFPELTPVRALAEAVPQAERPPYEQASAGRWQCQVDLSARLMEARRSVRHVPASSPAETVPPKCSLMGSFEQMGPEGLEESGEFWQRAARVFRIGGVRLRRQERLCAIALAKRFCGPAYFAESAGESLTAAFERYRAAITQPGRGNTDAEAFCQFVLLCRTASFLARGGSA